MNKVRTALRKVHQWWQHRAKEQRIVFVAWVGVVVLSGLAAGWLGALVVAGLTGLIALPLVILGKAVDHAASPEAMKAKAELAKQAAEREKVRAERRERIDDAVAPYFAGASVLALFALVVWGLFGSEIKDVVSSPNPERRAAELVGMAAPDTIRFTDDTGSQYFYLRPSHGLHGRYRTVKVRDRAPAGFYLETIEVDCTPGAVRVRWRALDSTDPSEHAALLTGNALAGTGRDQWHAPDETEYSQALGTNMEGALVRTVCR